MELKFEKARNFYAQINPDIYLFKDLWQEGTTALLHASRRVDKTVDALTIASETAATGREVLYIDVENRAKLHGEIAADSDNLYIFTPRYESVEDNCDYADLVFDAIMQAVNTTSIRTFVVDSVSRIAAMSFGKNASPTYVMKRLVALQRKYCLSMLVVADDSSKASVSALCFLAATDFTNEDIDGKPDEAAHAAYIDAPLTPLEDRQTELKVAPIIADSKDEISHVSIPPTGLQQESRRKRRAQRRRRKQQARLKQRERQQ